MAERRLSPEILTCSPEPCVLPNVQASEGGLPVNEDPIASNPRNPMQLLTGGNDYNCGSLQGFYASGDGGSTWSLNCLNTISGFYSGAGDPIVGYDRNGFAYTGGVNLKPGPTFEGVISLARSVNNGATWGATILAVNPVFPAGLTDKPWLQIDTNAASPHVNTLYISVTQYDSTGLNNEISVSHSSDGGKTWTTVPVDTEQIFPAIDQFSDLAIGKDGTVYVSWLRCTANGPAGDCGGTTASMVLSKSTDGGNTWSAPVTIAQVNLAPDSCICAYYGNLPGTFERVSDIPAIGIDNSSGPHAGNLYAVMYSWTGTQMRVGIVTSTNGGTTCSKPVPVAPSSQTHDQFFPWLSVSSTGTVGVTWLDRLNDPANLSYQAFAALSTNGGLSFSTNAALTPNLSNPNNDGFGGGFMGDYTGNIWAGNALVASWMDSSNGVNMQDQVGGLLQ